MGELDVRNNLKNNVSAAVAKNAQKPECWTPGVGSRVGWEAKFVPFVIGVDLVDFFVHYSAPVRGLFYSTFPAFNLPPFVGISFTPVGVKLSTTVGTLFQSFGMFELEANKLLLFDEDIQDIYVSISAFAPGSGQIALMGTRGFRSLFNTF